MNEYEMQTVDLLQFDMETSTLDQNANARKFTIVNQDKFISTTLLDEPNFSFIFFRTLLFFRGVL